MTQLRYSQEELLASHEYATPQVEAGHRLHGGFDINGAYIPPRTLWRGPAVENWSAARRPRGGDLFTAHS
jgi:hypothetical protein